MISLEVETTPFVEVIVTKFTKKSLTIRLFQEVQSLSDTPNVKYEITSHATGKVWEGIEENEGKALASAIAHVGFEPKERVLPEIRKYNHVRGNSHKIGNLEFNKVVRKAIS